MPRMKTCHDSLQNAGEMKSVITMYVCTFLVVLVALATETEGRTRPKRKWKYGCKLPVEPFYGHFEFNERLREIIYKCDDGFVLYGMDQDYRKCKWNRQWTGQHGDCIKNYYASRRCVSPAAPKHGFVTYTDNGDGTGLANFWCEQGYRLVGAKRLKCKSRDQWTGGSFPICRSEKTVEDLATIMKEDFFDPLSQATADADGDSHGKLSLGKTGLEMIMLVDISASIGKESLMTAKKFLKLIVDEFKVSSKANGGGNGTRVALITFSSEAELIFDLNDLNVRSVEAVKQKIDEIQNAGGGTNLKDALSKAALIAIRINNSRNADEKKRFKHSTRAVFILTDAEATFTDSATAKFNKFFIASHLETLKTTNFEVFAIGVGDPDYIDRKTLEEIATKPIQEHVFLTNNFKDLGRVTDIISEKNIDYGQCGIPGNFVRRGKDEAKQGAWPWLAWLGVMLPDDTAFTCGGTLLCDRWLLTAAHCVSYLDEKDKPQPAETININVNLGDHDIYFNSDDNNHIITGVTAVHLHPNYTGVVTKHGVRRFDVAVLDLGVDTFVPLNKFIRPICFPTEVNVGNGSEGVYGVSQAMLKSMLEVKGRNAREGFIAGWGHAPINTKIMQQPWARLQQDQRPVQTPQKCLKRFPGLDTDMFFCVFDSIKESRVCRGDVGGPLMDEMTNDRFTVLGLAAKTHDCQEDLGFSLFLNVMHPQISSWVGEKLDGCNRVQEDHSWANRTKQKLADIEEKRKEAERLAAEEAERLAAEEAKRLAAEADEGDDDEEEEEEEGEDAVDNVDDKDQQENEGEAMGKVGNFGGKDGNGEEGQKGEKKDRKKKNGQKKDRKKKNGQKKDRKKNKGKKNKGKKNKKNKQSQ